MVTWAAVKPSILIFSWHIKTAGKSRTGSANNLLFQKLAQARIRPVKPLTGPSMPVNQSSGRQTNEIACTRHDLAVSSREPMPQKRSSPAASLAIPHDFAQPRTKSATPALRIALRRRLTAKVLLCQPHQKRGLRTRLKCQSASR